MRNYCERVTLYFSASSLSLPPLRYATFLLFSPTIVVVVSFHFVLFQFAVRFFPLSLSLYSPAFVAVVAGANMLNYFYLKSRKTIVRRSQRPGVRERGVKGSVAGRGGGDTVQGTLSPFDILRL